MRYIILISIFVFYSCGYKEPTSVRIKQANGIGEKTIYDYDRTWDVLPFQLGDTISDIILCNRCLEPIHPVHLDKKYGWVVLEIKYSNKTCVEK